MQITTSETLIIEFSDQDEYLRMNVGNKKNGEVQIQNSYLL